MLHAAETVLEVAAISAASVLGLAAAGGIAYVELRARNRQATDRQAMSQRALTIRRDCQAVSAPPRLAIEAPRRNFTDLRSLAAKQGYDVVRREDRED